MPLDKHIEGGHGEREPGVARRPAPMHDLFAMALRHEVARLIVWHAVSTRPVVPSTVSYEEVREGHDPYRALGHGTHSFPTGTILARFAASWSVMALGFINTGKGCGRAA